MSVTMYNIWDFSRSAHYQCPEDQYILDRAEELGYNYPYSDRAGASDSSMAFAIHGKVDNSDGSFLNEMQLAAGFFLTDTSYPLSDLVIETDQRKVKEEFERFNADPLGWTRSYVF